MRDYRVVWESCKKKEIYSYFPWLDPVLSSLLLLLARLFLSFFAHNLPLFCPIPSVLVVATPLAHCCYCCLDYAREAKEPTSSSHHRGAVGFFGTAVIFATAAFTIANRASFFELLSSLSLALNSKDIHISAFPLEADAQEGRPEKGEGSGAGAREEDEEQKRTAAIVSRSDGPSRLRDVKTRGDSSRAPHRETDWTGLAGHL